MLSALPAPAHAEDLLVGHNTSDDAAVLKIDGTRAIVQTVDFFTPIVDDPRLFGQIACANAVSDVYAMGAEPILGLAIAAFPSDRLPLSVLEEILAGGEDKAREAGFPIGGGHTIIDEVPKYGLAVTGIVDVDKLVRNSTARPGDRIYVTKPIGNGILICAHRALGHAGGVKRMIRGTGPSLDEAVRWMLELNHGAATLLNECGVSAATDVTGYGLVGHLLEICSASGTGARVSVASVPLLEGARQWLQKGYSPAGTARNVDSFRRRVRSSVPEMDYRLLCDAQTSGGLLMTIAPEKAGELERRFRESGLLCAKIGDMTAEPGVVEILP